MIKEELWMFKYIIRNMCRQVFSWTEKIETWRRFWDSYRNYKKITSPDWQPSLQYLYPCLGDDTKETIIEPTYYYQDAWAFEKIVNQKPDFHIDVGSHNKYVTFLSKIIKVIMVDIRPLSLPMDSLKFCRGSIGNLPFKNASVPSVSSLCVVEHVGLGRYGDPLDPNGSECAINELKRIIQPGGDLYISLNVDDSNRVYFNAHRAFQVDYLIKLFKPFEVIESRYIYGKEYGSEIKPGFGTGCYHLKNVL